MTLLNSYLSQSKVKRILGRRPGEAGFSLIELVVVVAVLAILAAIAIPSFTSINNKARASAAQNTIATIAKVCAVGFANGEAAPTFPETTLDGYKSVELAGDTTKCKEKGDLIATSSDEEKAPTYTYNVATGAKSCTVTADSAAAPYCVSKKW